MRFDLLALMFVLVPTVGRADPPPTPRNSPPPVQPTPPAWSQGRSALDRLPPAPKVWDRIQDPMDRSMGRITDEQTYQLDRLNRERDEQLGRVRPQTEFERAQEERERRLRIEERSRHYQN